MLRLSDIRISTKLAVASGFGILLIAGLIASQYISNNKLEMVASDQNRVSEFSGAAAEAKGTARGYQIGAKDARLAENAQELAAAGKYLAARHEAMEGIVKTLLQDSKLQKNIDRINGLMADANAYAATVNEAIIKKKTVFEIKAKATGSEVSDVEQEKITALQTEFNKIVRERMLPAAEKMGATADELLVSAKQVDHDADIAAASARRGAAYLAYGLSFLVIIVQFGTAVFGAVSIAKPLRALVKPLEDLATGNFAV